MGARVALATAAACANEETPSFLKKKRRGKGGVHRGLARDRRRRREESARAPSGTTQLAETLRHSGVEPFARAWYTQGLFGSLTAHPRASLSRAWREDARRVCKKTATTRARAPPRARRRSGWRRQLSASPGRQIEVSAASLAASGVRVDFVTGALDAKFVKIAQTLAEETRVCLEASGVTEARVTESTVPGAGHAAHLEAPEALVLRLLRAVRFDEEL